MNPALIQILIIDPAGRFGAGIKRVLADAGFNVRSIRSVAKALSLAQSERFNLVLDCFGQDHERSPNGMDSVRQHSPDTQFILVSDGGTIRSAISAIRQGAFDYLAWPADNEQILRSVSQALEHQALVASDPEFRLRLRKRSETAIFAGSNQQIEAIQNQIRQVATADVTILIQGESGTGKEIAARALHEKSHRSEGPFIAVNCAALADSLIESELFGHVRGAFTGASSDKPGRFELAHGGSIFLDEIGDLSDKGQADLLRVLEDGVFRPVGSRTATRRDARVIAATNKDLEVEVGEGRFREDLYYRLSVITLQLPPLRERIEDLPELIEAFSSYFSVRHQRPPIRFTKSCQQALMGFAWPGNVRQLRNLVEGLVLTAHRRTIHPEDLPPRILGAREEMDSQMLYLGMSLADAERKLIKRTLAHSQGNRTEAAKLLQISRRSLYDKISRHGLQ